MKKPIIAAVMLSLLSTSAIAASAFSDAKDSVEYRQNAFQLIRHNMADISDMLKGDVAYDAKRVEARATALATLTTLPWEAFTVPGTQTGDAKDAVWKNMDDFQSRGAKLAEDALALKNAALTGEQADIRKAFGSFARNCKACHDQYKN